MVRTEMLLAQILTTLTVMALAEHPKNKNLDQLAKRNLALLARLQLDKQ